MANAKEPLTESILEILAQVPDGLEVTEIIEELGGDEVVSPRGVRNLINQLVKEEKLMKLKRPSQGRGTPPYAYYHPETLPKQLNIFDMMPGVSSKSRLFSRTEIEKEELDPQERESQEEALSVFKKIATNHLHEEAYAIAIMEIASKFAEENPINIIVQMTQWLVDDINTRGKQIERLFENKDFKVAKPMADKFEAHLGWARRYFQLFWRLDRSVADCPGVLDLPLGFNHFKKGQKAVFNEEAARTILQDRVIGNKMIEEWKQPIQHHKAVAGTDASVADIFLTRKPGSSIPNKPIVITTSASALIADSERLDKPYHDFDIYPDRLKEYDDYQAAKEGLVIAPELMGFLGNDRFKHSRMAAMELRQYTADFRLATEAPNQWRPFGDKPPKPTLIIRDGRVFPLLHRLNDYEDDTLFGQIVRNQIDKFQYVLHNTISVPIGEIVYGAAVKNPQMSWLSPLLFWYLYEKKYQIKGKLVIKSSDDIYKSPLGDTAVSHLLFLGIAKTLKTFPRQQLFTTCRVVRRFSDIALTEDSIPAVIREEYGQDRLLNEKSIEDWKKFIVQRLQQKKKTYHFTSLEEDNYKSFIRLCFQYGVFMCYCAPICAYKPLAFYRENGGHFLIPRLEIAIDLERDKDSYQTSLDRMLSWLAEEENWDRDHGHTQSGFDTGDRETSLPILIPKVTLLAHEAATFARDKLKEEVQDAIQKEIVKLIRELESWMEKGR